jgi:hypothetical protein
MFDFFLKKNTKIEYFMLNIASLFLSKIILKLSISKLMEIEIEIDSNQ